MANYRFLAADWQQERTIREEIPFEQVKFTQVLNGAGGFSASLPINHPKCKRSILDPARTIIYVERDGQIVGGWWIWTAKAGGGTVTFDGAELWSYYRHRYVRQDVNWGSTYFPPEYAEFLLLYPDNGYMPTDFDNNYISYDWGNDAEELMGQKWKSVERKCVADAIEELSRLRSSFPPDGGGGFDFWIDSRWGPSPSEANTTQVLDVFRVRQRRGRTLNLTFEDGATAENVEWTIDGTACANRVDVIGNGTADGAKIGSAEDTALYGGVDDPAPYPLLETIEKNNDTNKLSALNVWAKAFLAARKLPPEIVDVTAGQHPSVEFGTYGVGDTIRVRANHGYMQFNSTHRVTSIDVSIGPDNAELVKPSFTPEGSVG